MSTDPNLHWDGQQWHRWDGGRWLNQGPHADSGLVYPQSAPPVYTPAYAPATAQPGYGYQPQLAPMRINDSSSKPVETIIAWIGTVVTAGYQPPPIRPPSYQPPSYQPPSYEPPPYSPPAFGSDQAPRVTGSGVSLTKPLPQDHPTVELPDDPRPY